MGQAVYGKVVKVGAGMIIYRKAAWRALLGALLLTNALPLVFCQTTSAAGSGSQIPSDSTANIQAPAPATSEDDKKRLRVNPLTGQTTALSGHYTPLTPEERWKLYLKQSYWSVGAYFGPLFAALALDQATGTPPEWGGGLKGYGRRVASRYAAGNLVQNSFQFPVAALLKDDVRYIGSNQHGFGRRFGHAVLYSFMTYNNQGHRTLNVANIGGYYFAAAVSTTWLPESQKLGSYTLSNGSASLALSIPVNMLQEFWPEISRTVFRRK